MPIATPRPTAGQPAPYNPDIALERAGILLLNYKQFAAAVHPFARLVGETRTPNAPNPWYGLGNALGELARQTASLPLLLRAVSCLKRATLLQPGHPMAQGLLDNIRQFSGVPHAALDAESAFTGDTGVLISEAGATPDVLAQAVAAIAETPPRIQLIMFLGDQADRDYIPLLADRLEHDPDGDVRMAAAKRITAVPDHPRTREAFENIVAAGTWQPLEPYVSMALRRLSGQSSVAWANDLLAQITPPV